MARIDLTARARRYSLYLPSMQLGSAKSICAEPDQWQAAPLPNGLEPSDFNYLDPHNRYWSYGYALASAESFRGKVGNAVTSRDPATFILGDSGGYQIGKGSGEAGKWKGLSEQEVSAAFRNTPILQEVTDWCESHCDYAMTLDLPLWARRPRFSETPFHRCSVDTLLQLTLGNLEYLHDLQDRRCKYLNVLQGDTPSEEDHWYRHVKRFKFDGWSLAGGVGIVGGPYRILRRLLILADQGRLDKGYDWLHFLALSQFSWAPMMTAIQRGVRRFVKNKDFTVSYDSSSPYRMGGQHEKYFEAPKLTSDPDTWHYTEHKLPSTFGYASQNIALNSTTCTGKKCAMCAQGKQHLQAPLLSPIVKALHLADLVTNKSEHARRRVGTLFQEAIINHNVYVLVDGLIKANKAVFGKKPRAPQQLVDAVGLVTDDIFRVQNGHSLLRKHRQALEDAVGHKATKDVME